MSAARLGYTAFVWFAAPFAALYLLWRSRKQPEYRAHWGERFGWARYPHPGSKPLLWVHAVSVGETRAAEPLITGLLASSGVLAVVSLNRVVNRRHPPWPRARAPRHRIT